MDAISNHDKKASKIGAMLNKGRNQCESQLFNFKKHKKTLEDRLILMLNLVLWFVP